MSGLSDVDIDRMRDQLFFEGPERSQRLSRYWLLPPLAAVIASAGVVRRPPPVSGRLLAVRHQCRCHPGQRIVVMAFYRVHRLFGAAGSRYGGAVAVIAALLLW